MFRWLRFDVFVPLVFIIGVAQYGSAAIVAALHGNVVLWQMDNLAMESAGPLRYIKDAFLLIISVVWPIYAARRTWPKGTSKIIVLYLVWLLLILCIGLVGILVGYSPPIFLVAGIRWLMILHVSFGVFLLMWVCPIWSRPNRRVIYCLLGLAALDLMLITVQFGVGGATGNAFGHSRLTGFFSNAGVGGFFGLALVLVGLQMDDTSTKLRFLLSGGAMVIALSSGTRSMVISVFILTALQALEWVESRRDRRLTGPLKLAFGPAILVIAWLGYRWLIDAVDRGGMVETQLAHGGRISNFIDMMGVIYSADFGELLFGRGLGVGTNTAYTMLVAAGLDPGGFRFNWLIDNSFLTQFFQFGILGSLVFWSGVFGFLVLMRPRGLRKYVRRYWVTTALFFIILWAGNPFEQYFLMIPFSIAIGAAHWSARFNKNVAKPLAPRAAA